MKKCFVILPRNDHAKITLEDVYIPAIKASQMTPTWDPKNSDATGSSLKDIWEMISSADMVVVHMDGEASTVLHQLGLAQALSLPIVLVRPRTQTLPPLFDETRSISYDHTSPRGFKHLTESLSDWLETVAQKPTYAIDPNVGKQPRSLPKRTHKSDKLKTKTTLAKEELEREQAYQALQAEIDFLKSKLKATEIRLASTQNQINEMNA